MLPGRTTVPENVSEGCMAHGQASIGKGWMIHQRWPALLSRGAPGRPPAGPWARAWPSWSACCAAARACTAR